MTSPKIQVNSMKLFISQLEIFSKDTNNLQPLKRLTMLVTWLVFQLDISGNSSINNKLNKDSIVVTLLISYLDI